MYENCEEKKKLARYANDHDLTRCTMKFWYLEHNLILGSDNFDREANYKVLFISFPSRTFRSLIG